VPVFFTTVVYDEVGEAAAAVFLRKAPALRLCAPGTRWVELDPRLGRQESEPVIAKAHASAFFGTPFAALLAGRDTLVVCGASTSGCVRATVVDAMQHGLAPIVPRECVGDRSSRAHLQALEDIEGRYGDVRSVDEVIAALGE
jgi:nicotinamidase-related amidase